ncbi:MAG: hypothetical protein KDH17_05435 [Rhodocyclaceae bacterium]|nr:hypothetical protein [Rhodocyclaceae bacterium]
MVRLLKTPEQIREIVRARIDRIPEIREYAARIDVPLPTPRPPDATGCNWDMLDFGCAAPYERLIHCEVAAVRARVNLAEPVAT